MARTSSPPEHQRSNRAGAQTCRMPATLASQGQAGGPSAPGHELRASGTGGAAARPGARSITPRPARSAEPYYTTGWTRDTDGRTVAAIRIPAIQPHRTADCGQVAGWKPAVRAHPGARRRRCAHRTYRLRSGLKARDPAEPSVLRGPQRPAHRLLPADVERGALSLGHGWHVALVGALQRRQFLTR